MPWWEHLFHPSLWDWGDVGTWVQGIATTGTLWLGFTILRADRKRAERAQVSRIGVELIPNFDFPLGYDDSGRFIVPEHGIGTVDAKITNQSDLPIACYLISYEWRGTKFSIKAIRESHTEAKMIRPRRVGVGHVDLPVSGAMYEYHITLLLVDAAGVEWLYNSRKNVHFPIKLRDSRDLEKQVRILGCDIFSEQLSVYEI